MTQPGSSKDDAILDVLIVGETLFYVGESKSRFGSRAVMSLGPLARPHRRGGSAERLSRVSLSWTATRRVWEGLLW